MAYYTMKPVTYAKRVARFAQVVSVIRMDGSHGYEVRIAKCYDNDSVWTDVIYRTRDIATAVAEATANAHIVEFSNYDEQHAHVLAEYRKDQGT